MADEKKTKKKKAKKEKDEPASEPTPPPPEPELPAEGDDWLSAAAEPAVEDAPPTTDEEQAPVDAPPADQEAEEFLGEADVMAPPAAKKKPKFYIYWNRRKPKFYDYNYDYGKKYYSNIVDYIDHKNLGSSELLPRRTAFAQRGIDISLEHKNQPDYYTENLMHNVRSSIRGYECFQKDYAYDVDRAYFA